MDFDDHKFQRFLQAAGQGLTRSLKDLLSNIPNPNEYLNTVDEVTVNQKWSVLMAGCLTERIDLVRMLLESFQPDLEILNTVQIQIRDRDKDNQFETFEHVTVLWVAAAVNNLPLVQLLVEHGANVNHRTKTNSTPVRCACCNNNIDMVRYLIAHGADIHIAKIKHLTNLLASAYNGHLQMAIYLVDELGCDVNECSDNGQSPLNAAVSKGFLNIAQFLLEHGARNSLVDYNQMTPLMLAAENRRVDLVEAISPYCPLIEQIEGEELLASAFICIELGESSSDEAMKYLIRALGRRSIHQIRKPIQQSTHTVFNHRQECQTIGQLLTLEHNSDLMYIEALLIRERILGKRNKKYLHSLHVHGEILLDNEEYQAGLAMWMYELSLYQTESIEIDKEDLRYFVYALSFVIKQSVAIPMDCFYTLINVTSDKLKHPQNHSDYDYNLLTLLFFITITSKFLLETVVTHIDRQRLYQLISIIVQQRYVTTNSGSSLLHLSVDEQTQSNTEHFDDIFSYPSLITIRVLLQCGADVNGTDFRRSTPMHIFVSNTEDGYESIFELLYQANAHFDYTNDSGEIPLDLVRNANLKRLLMMKTRINLKCLCARLIQKENISFHGMISQSLASFVNKH